MKTGEIKKGKTPIISIDHTLNKYEHVVLFSEKVKKANDMIDKIGSPKIQKHLS